MSLNNKRRGYPLLFRAYSSSARSSNATRVASMTKAEKDAPVPRMETSTCSMTSLGKRMVFEVVEGMRQIFEESGG